MGTFDHLPDAIFVHFGFDCTLKGAGVCKHALLVPPHPQGSIGVSKESLVRIGRSLCQLNAERQRLLILATGKESESEMVEQIVGWRDGELSRKERFDALVHIITILCREKDVEGLGR
jgi:hypothetical protein